MYFHTSTRRLKFALNLDLMRKGGGQSWWPWEPGIRQLPIFGSSTSLFLLIWPMNYLVELGETWLNILSFVFSIVEINDQWKRKTKEFPEKRWISCPFKTHLHPRGGFLFLHWSKFLFTLSSSHLLAYMSAHMQCIAPTPSYEGNNYVRSNLTCSTVDQECQQQTQHTTNTAWKPRIIVLHLQLTCKRLFSCPFFTSTIIIARAEQLLWSVLFFSNVIMIFVHFSASSSTFARICGAFLWGHNCHLFLPSWPHIDQVCLFWPNIDQVCLS